MYDKLIDDYIGEVTNNMGVRQRDEVARELRTHILDSADAMAAERKTTVDDVIIRQVIAKMGPAAQVAALYPTKKTFLEMKEMKGMWDAMKALAGLAVLVALVGIILMIVSPETITSAPVMVIFQVVFALGIAAFVIGIIFLVMYLYETELKSTYEARLKRLEKSLNDAESPIKVGMTIFATIAWLIIMNVFWTRLPFVSSFHEDAVLIPVLSAAFAGFVLWFNVLGILGIGVQLLFLAMREKWVPSLLEAIMGLCTAVLFAAILMAMPFNPALPAEFFTVVKIFLAIVIALCLFDAGKKLWQTARLFIHERYQQNSAA
jgi:MFS family permease